MFLVLVGFSGFSLGFYEAGGSIGKTRHQTRGSLEGTPPGTKIVRLQDLVHRLVEFAPVKSCRECRLGMISNEFSHVNIIVVIASIPRDTPILIALEALARPWAEDASLGRISNAKLTSIGVRVMTVRGSEIMCSTPTVRR